MATDVKHDQEPSTTSLVSGILSDAQDLMKQQFELLKAEVRSDVAKTKASMITLGVGVGVASLGGIVLVFALVYLLKWAFPQLELWACHAIVGGVITAAGVVFFFVGKAKLESFNPLPDETATALKENVQWITKPTPK